MGGPEVAATQLMGPCWLVGPGAFLACAGGSPGMCPCPSAALQERTAPAAHRARELVPSSDPCSLSPAHRLAPSVALEQRWDEVLDACSGRRLHLRASRGSRRTPRESAGQVHAHQCLNEGVAWRPALTGMMGRNSGLSKGMLP